MAQSVTVGAAGDEETVPTIYINAGAGNVPVTEGWVGVSGVSKQFFAGLDASHAPAGAGSNLDGLRAPAAGNVVVTPTDGVAGYTITWARNNGDVEPDISSPTSFSVFWTIGSPDNYTATWRYTVTDAHGVQTIGFVSVNFSLGN